MIRRLIQINPALLCVLAPLCADIHKKKLKTNAHSTFPVPLSSSRRAQSERNPWVVLTAALLTRCQGSGVELDLGQQVVDMVRSLYRTKHKLPAQVKKKKEEQTPAVPDKQTVSLFFLLCCQCTTRIMFKIFYRYVFCLFHYWEMLHFQLNICLRCFSLILCHIQHHVYCTYSEFSTQTSFFPSRPKLKVPHVKSINFYSFRGPSEVNALYETQQENNESHFYSPFNFFFFTSLFWLTLRGSGCLAPTQGHRRRCWKRPASRSHVSISSLLLSNILPPLLPPSIAPAVR